MVPERQAPGPSEHPCNMHRAGRGLFRRHQYDRAACSQRPGYLARRLSHRKIPRRERRHTADRLAHDDLTNARRAWNYAAVQSLSLCSIPFKELASPNGFQSRLPDGLAQFQGDRSGDFLVPVPHELCSLQDNPAALNRRSPAPYPESLLGGLDRVIQIPLQATGSNPISDSSAGLTIGRCSLDCSHFPPMNSRMAGYDVILSLAGWPALGIPAGFDSIRYCNTIGR